MSVPKLGVALILASQVLVGGAIGADEEAKRPLPDGVLTAADFVRAALEAEGNGDATQRAQYLKEALADDPEYAPARWHSGFLRQGDRWLTIPASQEEFRADSRLDAYAHYRESLPESAERELLLARWCQNQRLSEQAEFHWLNVLQWQPGHEEALQALDVTWYQGRLVKRDTLAQQKRAEYQAARNTFNANPTLKRRCEATIVRWEHLADTDAPSLQTTMEADMAAETNPGAVLLINSMLGERFRVPRNPRELEQVCVAWMKILAKDEQYTKLLVSQSIWHPREAVRHAAADELKPKRWESFVPLYLVSASFPIEFACSTMANSGLSSLQLTLNVEGLDSDIQLEHIASFEQVVPLSESLLPIPEPGVTDIYYGGDVAAKRNLAKDAAWRASAQQAALNIQARVNRYNAISAAINERVTTALARATGGQSESNPRAWQNWWNAYLVDYYELEGADEDASLADDSGQFQSEPGRATFPAATATRDRPAQKFSSNSAQQEIIQPTQPLRGSQQPRYPGKIRAVTIGYGTGVFPLGNGWVQVRISCFAGPTPVWTSTGLRPIQDIRPGDQVLSQNAATGEVAYKVVELVTKRAPSPMIRVQVDSEEILATRGHPFWVLGKGWTMAKHLQVGDLLHAVTGPVAITHVEAAPAPEAWYDVAYNLQVRDFHTYFVGQQQLLVHHLSMLAILDERSTIVPGL